MIALRFRRMTWEESLELIGYLADIVAKLKVVAPFLCGVKEVVYDANFFHSTLGLHRGGSMWTRSLQKKCPNFWWQHTWAPQKGERGKVHIDVCNNQEVKQQILLLYKRICGQKPNRGFFSIHFVHIATLRCQYDINITFAEHVAKITLKHINKAHSNPWKLTLLTLREHVQAMLTILAVFEAPILISSTHQTPTKSEHPRLALGETPMASPLSLVLPSTLEQIENTLDGIKRMVQQGQILQ